MMTMNPNANAKQVRKERPAALPSVSRTVEEALPPAVVNPPVVVESPPAESEDIAATEPDQPGSGIEYVMIEVPILRDRGGYVTRQVNVKGLSASQQLALKGLREGMDVGGHVLANGKHVRDWGDVIRCVLEQVAAAMEQ